MSATPIAWRFRLRGLQLWNFALGPTFDIAQPEAYEKDALVLATALSAQEAEIAGLRDALGQLLDDMGETGLSVCQAAKDMAIARLKDEG